MLVLRSGSHPKGKLPGIWRSLTSHIWHIWKDHLLPGHQQGHTEWMRPGAAHSHPPPRGTHEHIPDSHRLQGFRTPPCVSSKSEAQAGTVLSHCSRSVHTSPAMTNGLPPQRVQRGQRINKTASSLLHIGKGLILLWH